MALYKKIIIDKHITDVVVASLFIEERSNESIHFSNQCRLFYNECADEKEIIKDLSLITKVLRRSSEVMAYFKRNLE